MIFIGFLLISSIFFIFAAISGNVGYFVNYDSFLILIVADVIFSIFTFRWKVFIRGVKSMFVLNGHSYTKDNHVAAHFKSLMMVTIAVGVISSIQGFFSYALAVRDSVESALSLALIEVLCYTGFTTVYALMLSFLLFYPVYLLNLETDPTKFS